MEINLPASNWPFNPSYLHISDAGMQRVLKIKTRIFSGKGSQQKLGFNNLLRTFLSKLNRTFSFP
jgi:hypothetical protein